MKTVCLSLAAVFASSAFGFTLAERGRIGSEKVLLPAEANECVRYAAEELETYAARLTGSKLCGKVAFAFDTSIRYDGFRLKVEGGVLRISAAVDRGLLYGVYELLETYGGCGWFSSWTDVVPKIAKFEVPDTLDVVSEPDIEFREAFTYDYNSQNEFAARLRKNAYLWTGTKAKTGGNAFAPGAGLRGHTFARIIPVEKYFDAHPEYFAEENGKRQRTKPQLCCSNPELRRVYADNMIAEMRKDPNKQFYAIGHNDSRNFCTCAKCREIMDREGCTGAPEFELANYVADRVAKEFPKALVKVSAYEVSRRPPKHMKLRPNVLLDLCPIECDYSVPIPESPYKENVAFLEDIEGWSKCCDKMMIFDYVTNFGGYLNVFPNLFSLQDNLKLFKKYGAVYVCEEGCHNGLHGEFTELKGYLLSKLMWKIDQPVKPLIEKFCRGYYGEAAAPYVLEYIVLMQDLNMKRDHHRYPLRIMERFDVPLYDDAFLDAALRLWEKAEKAAEASGDKVRLSNVRFGELVPVMMILQRQSYGVNVRPVPFPDARIRRLAAFAQKRIEECPGLCTSEGGFDRGLKERIRRLADPAYTMPAGDAAIVEAEDVFKVWGGFQSGVRDDPGASGGKAIQFSNRYSGDWVSYFPMSYFGREKGVKYRFSIRVRCDRAAGMPDGNAMLTLRHCDGVKNERQHPASEIGTDYRWVELGVWEPVADREQLVVAPGRFDRGKYAANPALERLWFDQIRIEKAGDIQ